MVCQSEKLCRKMIGTCGFTKITVEYNSAEIGYVLNPSYWGYGIAPEAVTAADSARDFSALIYYIYV